MSKPVMNHADTTGRPATDVDSRIPDLRVWTIPNVLSAIRLIGSCVMFAMSLGGYATEFLVMFVLLEVTDWLDGKLAIWLDQRTVFGARIDSAADFALASALLWGGAILKWDIVKHELIWMAPTIGSYAVSELFGLWKFGRLPTYHTRAAKTSWGLITIGALTLLTGWAVWPFRITMLVVLLTNLEAILITARLQEWRVDVRSIFDILAEKRATPTDSDKR